MHKNAKILRKKNTVQNLNLTDKGQRGRSMIEMLGVLAIIGVLSVGGLAGYNMAMEKIRTNKVVEEIQLIMSALDGFNPASGNKIPNLNYKSYVDTAPLEEALSVMGAKLRALNSGSDTRYTYYMGLDNVSEELCLELLTKLDDGTDSITVSKVTSYEDSALLHSTKARQICKGGEQGRLAVDFYFGSTASAGKKENK